MAGTRGKWRQFSMVKQSVIVSFCLVVVACSTQDFSDLESYIEEVRINQKGRVDPLPQFKPFETFAYTADSIRSPFKPWIDESENEGKGNLSAIGPQPDFNRRKELLERFPLDSLLMVGTLEQKDGFWAIIQAPDGMVHRVKRGNYLGQNYGEIISLADTKVDIKELIPDGLGGWQERQGFLTLEE